MSDKDFDKQLESLRNRANQSQGIGRALDRLERIERYKPLREDAETFRLPYASVPHADHESWA